eukprot:6187462-Pleurochrysis_carterae.AAC.1
MAQSKLEYEAAKSDVSLSESGVCSQLPTAYGAADRGRSSRHTVSWTGCFLDVQQLIRLALPRHIV